MKYQENIKAVAALQPDYLGFIFYGNSSRNFEGDIPSIPSTIKKAGVFVDASIDFIAQKVKQYNFKTIQLHGNESARFCTDLQGIENLRGIDIWKVFSIKDKFDFSTLQPYEGIVDYFLFDTKGEQKGGNGYPFDWHVLNNYPSSTPLILSGGIGLAEIDKIKELLKTNLPIHAIDVNSAFEIKPGLKNVADLLVFKNQLDALKGA